MASVGLDAFYDFIEDQARSADAARRRPPLALGMAAYGVASVIAVRYANWGKER